MTIHGTKTLITLIKVPCKIHSSSMTCYALSLYHTVYNLASHKRSSKKISHITTQMVLQGSLITSIHIGVRQST